MALLETDPYDLALGEDGDLAIGEDGGPYFTRGLPAIKQACYIAVSMIRGEWFLDLDAGVPWLERDGVDAATAILGQRFDEGKVRREVRAALFSVPEVVDVPVLTATFNASTRKISVSWEATTAFGETIEDSLERGI